MPSSLTTSASTPTGVEPGELGEVDAGLGVAGAGQHAAVAGDQREDVAGAQEVAAAMQLSLASARTVLARSSAEMPVVMPTR